MLFNSIDFAIFLPLVFLLYWFGTGKNINTQNVLLLVSSYFFYGWWDWRFLILILISTLVDYAVGIAIPKQTSTLKRKVLLLVSITVNLGILGFFKYFNFFIESFASVFSVFGQHIQSTRLNIILPVGMSFYTLQTLSYTIDIYRNKIKPNRNFVAFAAFVSFFPQLVAGPIERAGNLLPQFLTKRTFNYRQASDGLKQILWGLMKKVVIADNCAEIVDQVFQNSDFFPSSTLAIASILFTIQLYADFSGYSDIAIGTAHLFGFNLKQNFAFPLFAKSIPEFWRNWHISLSTWLRDYIYIPLGGNKSNKLKTFRNLSITFLLGGLWHGANWTFIVWGLANALIYAPYLMFKDKFYTSKSLSNLANKKVIAVGNMLVTFGLVTLTLTIFRAQSLAHAFAYINGLFAGSFFTIPQFNNMGKLVLIIGLLVPFFIMEWYGRKHQYAIELFASNWPRALRWSFYAGIVFIIGMYMQTTTSPFIYFQF